ncbi:lysine N(6)-hydroxylase/L-ornithine N(5)-oxygenase family protein [Alkalihalobacillus hwajinpoensis]|uniref:lysine N(6)-hydroxylase/L-ornithine N(5)-oxygenase family protein n=1 Tax=Guptibacillus hwajinpoensis TaxID=208199 RepID=UPI001883BC67|nr:lysine N(6)-hydroxylase/L-ornithine N(5)-oxygenase family protein [Pseudalkalibacillus hwajinpoensis]MBF0708723.1 lysine N(6)-hydroxylase/L-ornithine N(5)-oxygenase family protein [Pseudalkalibacillus hwajinpoensis]
MKQKVYDLIGVGIGPFNLGLAALMDPIKEMDTLFFEQKEQFNWHPGMLIEGTRLQVPFMADLVTMADPTNPYSYLNYLKHHNRLYHFYFLQRLEMPRNEYNHYCQWAANQLESCQFGSKVLAVVPIGKPVERYEITVEKLTTGETETYVAKNIILGVGTIPSLPKALQDFPEEDVFHSSTFLDHTERCKQAKKITVIGSGQSSAEIFRELLKERQEYGYSLNWVTRSQGFFPMEETRLSLEHFSPEYVDYFYDLPQEQKDDIFKGQQLLYKGISPHTITDIYNLLYEQSVGGKDMDVMLMPLTEINGVREKEDGTGYEVECRQWQKGENFLLDSEVIIAGTGYRPLIPKCLQDLEEIIDWDEQGRYHVSKDYRLNLTCEASSHIFVHSGMQHTHGVGSTNLGLAVNRNKIIINQLAEKEIYPVLEGNIFQQFEL